ncbi:MAG TPA: hypothetical protein PLN69_04540 [bacterium]|nr:hypothetical protein [bacterium]
MALLYIIIPAAAYTIRIYNCYKNVLAYGGYFGRSDAEIDDLEDWELVYIFALGTDRIGNTMADKFRNELVKRGLFEESGDDRDLFIKTDGKFMSGSVIGFETIFATKKYLFVAKPSFVYKPFLIMYHDIEDIWIAKIKRSVLARNKGFEIVIKYKKKGKYHKQHIQSANINEWYDLIKNFTSKTN